VNVKLLPILAIVLLASCTEDRASITPTRGPIVSAVYASGVVKAHDQYAASSVVNGILAAVYVQAGDHVKSGDPLFMIDDRIAQVGVQAAGSQYELARRNAAHNSPLLSERRAAVALARDRMHQDSLLFVRKRALWEQKIGSRLEFEQRELAYASARTAFENARAALQNTESELQNALVTARSNFENQVAMRDDRLIRSQVDGIVYAVNIEPGELVSPQQQLAVLGSADRFEMELQVDEMDIARVSPGQEVAVTLDSYPKEVFTGEITRVDPMMDQRSRTFTVQAAFTKAPQKLYPNLTVEANIVIERKEDALIIPAAYLVEGDQVMVAEDGSRPVKIGLRDLQQVEVLEGIDEGTRIYRP
jgi:multidrug efflux pump subunit AcrA (membrane-fusion protein)